MGRPSAKRYDVVVIGAGIGGLVCSAFLSRKGKKVLLVEQHSKPGGYCTTFKRKGFIFDAAVHHIGGCGRYSIVGRCLKELGLEMEFFRLDPMDSLIFPDFSIDIPAEIEDYITLLGKKYPLEKGHVEKFFKDFVKLYWAIINGASDSPTLNNYKNMTYKEMLDSFFEDEELKRTLAGQWGYLGTPPEEVSSIGMCQMLINYLRDGAYYPRGGTQNFANGLAKNFTESGGEALLSTMAEEILMDGRKVMGVKLEGGGEALADVVVSNVDARQTFSCLVKEELGHTYSERLGGMKESPSYFLLYLGLDPGIDLKGFRRGFYHGPGNQWKYVSAPTKVDSSLAPGGRQILNVVATIEESYEEVRDWKALKDRLTQENINYLDRLIPAPGGLRKHIEVVEAATPRTLERYTLNSRGAAYGWAVTPEQTGPGRLDHRTPVDNLFLAGHWTNPGPGVCAVVSSGWRVANLILNR
ncbi:MAG TPA: phytoene desaturase family protein [Candidatus Tripitaka californicus]|uniref:phytoene desaturase family protein n=1 Tax=Candidatus Tripitaka californicus TaxID=3367616 RepID=UPI004024A913